MLLVEAEEKQLRGLLGESGLWLIAPEQSYEIPEKPARIEKKLSDYSP
jgi:hypothetical protein